MKTIKTLETLKGKKRLLIEQLMKQGITDELVLEAINYLPREEFIPSTFINSVYENTALPIECRQTISQPYTVAFMTQLLEVKNNDKILEIGTGSAYQASILYLLGADVYTIERHELLYQKAIEKFAKFEFDIHAFLGDGTLGLPEHAPYDSIIITAAAPEIPENLVKQLKINGRMVVPVGDLHSQEMILLIRSDEKEYIYQKHGSFKFVPMIGENGWEE